MEELLQLSILIEDLGRPTFYQRYGIEFPGQEEYSFKKRLETLRRLVTRLVVNG